MWRFVSPYIRFGKGSLKSLRDLDGRRVLIITDHGVERAGLVKKVVDNLEKARIETRVYAGVQPDPSTDNVSEGLEEARKFKPDWIVGLGGGSSMDCAKAVWIFYERPDLTWGDLADASLKLGLRKKARLITIPTTSGTGADSTWAIVITDLKRHVKMEFAFDEVVADMAILDPELTLTLPPRITAGTGLDVLTHAVEAYTSSWKNDFTDGLALKAIGIVFEHLPVACSKGDDVRAREKMHNAATIAGLAFGNSQAGFAHSVGHSLGSVFKTPHGRAVGLALPYVIQFNRKRAGRLYAEITNFIGIRAKSDLDASKKLANRVKGLIKEINEPLTIKDLGISAEDFKAKLRELTRKALQDDCTSMNPRIPSKEECEKIFEYAYSGKGVDF